ncbi:MAG TPA: hypothetical protein VKY19_01520 [Ktedonosporobacter sp.]|jgi:hypothetical protein|nr:hypothetical protein [Ktedonosporobacter sp.]
MNLWADLENNRLPPHDTMEQGRWQRARRPTERIILSSLREWLLQDYAASYCRSLGATRIYRRCYWIDGLGIDSKVTGPVQIPVEPEQQNGSRTGKGRKKGVAPVVPPILQPVVTLSQALEQESKPITLCGLMTEAGSSKRRSGREKKNGAVREIALPKESGIVQASWLEVAPLLLKEIEQSPAIFLLNPFGPATFTQDDLTALYQRTVPTELCLLLSYKQIETCLLLARRSSEQAATLTGLLRTDRWKALPTADEEREQAVDGFVTLFIAGMQRHFQFPVQSITLPMQTRPAVVEEAPYLLLFATRRQDSLLSMNDAVYRYHRHINEQSHQGVLGAEWFAAQQRERADEALEQLYQRTLQQGRTQRIRRWPDLRQQLLLANFGRYSVYDYDMIMRKLLLNNEVRCEWRRAPIDPEETRIPGSDDTLIWR